MSDNNVLSATTFISKRLEMKDRDGINWLIDLFINELPNYQTDLQQALTAGDGEALFLAAHKFKGSCSNLGAVSMVALCKRLEVLGRASDLEPATIVMENELLKEITLLKKALEQEKQQEFN